MMLVALRTVLVSRLLVSAALMLLGFAAISAQAGTEQAGQQQAWIDVSLDAQGRVINAAVVQQPPAVTRDLESWVKATSFDPAVVNAEPVPSTTSVSVQFSLSDADQGYGLKVLSHTTGPRPISIEQAKYPRSARKEGLEGWVDLYVTMDAKGKVTEATVGRSSDESFVKNAKKAIKHWKYKVPTVNGRAIGTVTEQTVYFTSPQD